MQTEFAISLAKNEGSLGDSTAAAIFHRDLFIGCLLGRDRRKELSFWRTSNGSAAL